MNQELVHSYSNNIKNKKVAILGPYPPPLGGVSIHVRRVMKKLNKQNNTVCLFDTVAKHRWRFWLYLIKLVFFIIKFRPEIVHYHTIYLENSIPELMLIFFIKKFFCYKIVFIEHNCRHLYKRDDWFKKKINYFLQQSSMVFIGDSTHKSYVDNKIIVKDFSIESAFLPPDLLREEKILKTYSNELFKFIFSGKPVLIANGFQLSFLDGKDLYGFDVCVRLVYHFKKKHPDVRLVFALANVGDKEYFEKLKNMIKKLDVIENVYFLTGQKELWPLLKLADIFLRPTLSDSFGISVAEAILFGTPAVASDVCIRQKGTVLFKKGDEKDFIKKVNGILN